MWWRVVFRLPPPVPLRSLVPVPLPVRANKLLFRFNAYAKTGAAVTLVASSALYSALSQPAHCDASPVEPPKIISTTKETTSTVSSTPPETTWVLGWRDVVSVIKILLFGGIAYFLMGLFAGQFLFRVLAAYGRPVSLLVSIPSSMLSAAVATGVGLYRGVGHSLIYFVDKGAVRQILNKIVPAGAADVAILHWDGTVSRIASAFRVKAEQYHFFIRTVMRVVAQRLENFLVLVKEEDKVRQEPLSAEVVDRKLKKLIRRKMRKALYVASAIYGAALAAVAFAIW